MQAAAEHQREATSTEVEAMTRAHLERVRVRAAAEAEELRRMAQADIDEINAWQEAEAVRLREEAARRIVARGEELDEYLVRHAAIIDTEVDQIEGAVANYQLELDGYFGKLTTESDPGEIARLADELPAAPGPGEGRRRGTGPGLAAVAAEGDSARRAETGDRRGGRRDERRRSAPKAPGRAPRAGDGPQERLRSGRRRRHERRATERKTNPAIRILRSIATLATPAARRRQVPTTATATRPPRPVDRDAGAGRRRPSTTSPIPTQPAPDPVEAAKD